MKKYFLIILLSIAFQSFIRAQTKDGYTFIMEHAHMGGLRYAELEKCKLSLKNNPFYSISNFTATVITKKGEVFVYPTKGGHLNNQTISTIIAKKGKKLVITDIYFWCDGKKTSANDYELSFSLK